MRKPFKDTRFGKIITNVVAPIAEGAAQSLPGGNLVTKGVPAILKLIGILKPKTAPDGSTVKGPNWFALIIEAVAVGAIGWAFWTKTITIDQLIEYLNQVLSQFS